MTTSTIPVELLTAQETAAWLRVTQNQLWRLRAAGLGPTWVRVGRAIRYPRSGVEDFLREQTRAAEERS